MFIHENSRWFTHSKSTHHRLSIKLQGGGTGTYYLASTVGSPHNNGSLTVLYCTLYRSSSTYGGLHKDKVVAMSLPKGIAEQIQNSVVPGVY